MARIVCAAPPLFGHMTPLVALAQALQAQGHEVAVVDYFVNPFHLPDGLQRIAIPSARLDRAVQETGGNNFVLDLIYVLRDFCLEVFPRTLEQCHAFRPDLLICDQQLPIAPLLAARLGCPYVGTISTPVTFLYRDDQASAVDKGIKQAFTDAYATMCADLVLRLRGPALLPPPRRNLCFATALFCNQPAADGHYVTDPAITQQPVPVSFIGPAFLPRPPTGEDEALAARIAAFPGRRIYVSLGSCLANAEVNREAALKIFRNTLLAHNDPDTLLLYSAPEALLTEAFRDLDTRATVLARPFVNQFYLMPHFSLLYGHAGYNTLAECLCHALPQVTFPFVFDQTRMAHRLEELGVGKRVSRIRHSPPLLRDYADTLLGEPAVKTRLAALQADLRQFDGPRCGAEVLGALLTGC